MHGRREWEEKKNEELHAYHFQPCHCAVYVCVKNESKLPIWRLAEKTKTHTESTRDIRRRQQQHGDDDDDDRKNAVAMDAAERKHLTQHPPLAQINCMKTDDAGDEEKNILFYYYLRKATYLKYTCAKNQFDLT